MPSRASGLLVRHTYYAPCLPGLDERAELGRFILTFMPARAVEPGGDMDGIYI